MLTFFCVCLGQCNTTPYENAHKGRKTAAYAFLQRSHCPQCQTRETWIWRARWYAVLIKPQKYSMLEINIDLLYISLYYIWTSDCAFCVLNSNRRDRDVIMWYKMFKNNYYCDIHTGSHLRFMCICVWISMQGTCALFIVCLFVKWNLLLKKNITKSLFEN